MSKFHYWELVRTDPIPSYRSREAEGCAMPDAYLNGRPVYFGDLDCSFCDSYFLSAWWADTDAELSDEELEALTEQEQDYIVEQNMERHGYWED